MAEEKLFVIPLRKEFLKAPKYKRTKKAKTALREFVSKHMKVSLNNVKISIDLNLFLWSRGKKNPVSKIKVKIIKIDENVYVQLVDHDFDLPKKETKETLKEKLLGKKDKKNEPETEKEKQKELAKEVEKELVKEQHKEHEGHHKIVGEPDKKSDNESASKFKKEKVVSSPGKKDSHEPKR